jgi:dTMP kinase
MRQGYFITLEGPDGAGKTTQLALLGENAAALGIDLLFAREPGGTAVGDAVREVLLNPAFEEMVPLTEVFLYAAARAQLYRQILAPALAEGRLILCDRFIDSTLAYQVYGGQMDYDFVLQANLKAIDGRMPDKTFLLDIEPSCGLTRGAVRCADRMERKPLAFHQRVRNGFLELARSFPGRIVVVDGMQHPRQVAAQIWEHVRPDLEKLL